VPTNLAFAALVFDGEVVGAADAVWLQDADGLAAPADVMRVACDELDDAGESCLAITPRGALRASSSYALRTGVALRDAYGAPLPSFTSSFITATGADRQRPRWQDLACGIDEQAVDAGCALIDDTRITLRLQADEAVRFTIDDGRAKHVELSARGALHWTQSDLSEDTTLRFAVAAIDAAGNTTRTSFSLTTEHDLPTLSISEVLANPRGPEPAQELVEVHNFGREPIALDGFALSDSADQPGTPFVTDAVVQPGARVLLVPDAFVPDDTLDVPPPPGTLLVHVGKSLGKAGLANAGEPLFLRDPLGRRVSAAPASPPPKPGVCIVRTSPDPRSGEPSSFGYDAGDSCTPGR
jgi:hypothetical protein